MFKLFSLEEANSLIPHLNDLLSTMQIDVSDILRLRQEVAEGDPLSIEVRNKKQELQFLIRDVQQNKLELDQLGVFLKDVDTGLIDVPSQVGPEVVYLTWEKGQERITHYHRLSEVTKLPLYGAAEPQIQL